MTKQELRNKYKILRQALDDATIDDLSRACFGVLFANFDLTNKFVGLFLPIQAKKEPNMFLLFTECLKEKTSYFAPKIDVGSNIINFYSIQNLDHITIGPYQIPEPLSEEKIELNKLNIILIPLFCFDSKGNRVGYGKGYYDRLLESAPQHLVKIGISLFDEIEIIDDVSDNDIPLDYAITPNKLIQFAREKKSR
jgi:5-formyltetrahydrofolate cyclo-ligase